MAVRTVDNSPWAQFSRAMLTGLVAILPLAFTIMVLGWVVSLVHSFAGPNSFCGRILRSIGMSIVACDITAYAVGLIAAVATIYFLGLLIENGAGRRLSRTVDDVLQRVPVLGTVYDASKQVTSILDRNPEAQQNMTPVLCMFGEGGGSWTPALMPTPELVRVDGVDYHIVLIPTAPVPFGGALLCVRKEWIKPSTCGLDDLLGVYMSMGVTAPRCLASDAPASEPKLA